MVFPALHRLRVAPRLNLTRGPWELLVRPNNTCRSWSELPFRRSPSATMSTNGILSFVIYLSLRSQIAGRSHWTWKLRFQALAFLAALHLRSWYKFICRSVTGCGAIERLCRTALGNSGLWINENGIEIRSGEMRRLVWWIG